MKLNEIQDLIKFVAKSGVSEVELETKDVKIVIKTSTGKKDHVLVQTATQPVFQTSAPAIQQQAPMQDSKQGDAKTPVAADDESKYIVVKSPMIGTFYRSSSPDKAAFVTVGDDIEPGKTVCIIEAMKLFNEIEAEVRGKIVKVLVTDATPVEYDQPLFLVDPS